MIQTTEEVKLTKKITPINDGLLILVEKVTDMTKGGVYITEAMKKEFRDKINKPLYVTAVGDNVKNIKVGQSVLRKDQATITFLEDYDSGVPGYEYGILPYHGVLAIVSDFE